MALNGIQLKNLIGNVGGGCGNIGGGIGSSFCNSIFTGIGGNNPFGNELSYMASGLMNGGNFWELIGCMAQNMGQRAVGMAVNVVTDALGGLLGSLLSVAKEKVVAKKNENGIKKNNDNAERTVSQGVKKANNAIVKATEQINGYNADITTLMSVIENSQELSAKAKADFEAQVVELQAKIAEYNKKVAEQDALEAKLANTTDEKEKQKIQKELGKLSAEIVGLSSGIKEIKSTIKTIQRAIQAEIANSTEAAKKANETQTLAQAATDSLQSDVETISADTVQGVENYLAQGANFAAQLMQSSQLYKQKGAMLAGTGALLSATGIGAIFGAGKAAKAAEWIALGVSALSGANNGANLLTSTIQGFGTEWAGLSTPINGFNGLVQGLGTGIEDVLNLNVNFQEQATELLAQTEVYVSEDEQKRQVA